MTAGGGRSPARVHHVRGCSGFTLLELLVVIAVVGLLAGMAVAGAREAKIRAAEAAAISALHSINQAQFAYMHSCGEGRYAPTLVSLGVPVSGADEGFVSRDLAASDPLQKSGYVLELKGTEPASGGRSCTGLVPVETYRLTADPLVPGSTGRRFFGTNTDRVIYEDVTSFVDDMPEKGAPGHGAEIR